MTAKELLPGMEIETSRWGICTVLGTYYAGKWLIVELLDSTGSEHELRKFRDSLVATTSDNEHQP